MKTYQENLLLRTKDCDVNGEWRFSAILEALQETAGGHCDQMGCGRNDLKEKGIAWVLIRSEVQMERYPVIGEQVSVETFHLPTRHRLFPRFFVIRDNEEKVVGKASTLWALMDLNTRQTVPSDEVAAMMPDNSDLKPPMRLPSAITLPKNTKEEERIYQPCYTDLDANGHMNNTKYADLLCNLLGTEELRAYSIQSMVLNYNAEILPDQQVLLVFQRGGLQCRLAGLCELQMAFEIGCTLKTRRK